MAKQSSRTTGSRDLGLAGVQQQPTDEGLSLDQLNQAFANLLGTGHDPYAPPPEPVIPNAEEAALVEAAPIADLDDDTGCEITPRSILEAMLFVGHPQNEPLSSVKVAGLMRGVRPAEIDDLVRELNETYARENRPYAISSVGDGYRLTLREEFVGIRTLVHGRERQHRLSTAALEILSLAAYHGSIAADEINRLRGAASGSVLAQLVRRQLLSVEKPDGKPRQLIYRTTKRFLELFGLESLDDLPRSQDVEKR